MAVFRTFGRGAKASTLEGDANEGEMNFAFINMGQGDCTIISDPGNTVYIVDCGTTSMDDEKYYDEAKKIVRAWAGNKPVNLIVTHPDSDHYNRFPNMLFGTKPVVNVNVIYFSRAKDDESPLGNYTINGFNNLPAKVGFPLLIEVTLNATEHRRKNWSRITDYNGGVESDIPATGYVLASGKTKNGKDWSITIIAGNVPTRSISTSSTANNVVSLCTVIKLGEDKAFLTGDATEETLTYLYNHQRNHFKDCAIFQVPHHGSESSVPTDDFKNYVNPETLLVSVGLGSYSYKLPREIVLDQWLTCSRLREVDREYDEWVLGSEKYTTIPELNSILTLWGNKNFEYKSTSSFNWLLDPKNGPKSGTVFWGFTNSGYFIYRRKSSKDIYTTGVYGNMTDESFYESAALANHPSTEEDNGHRTVENPD